MNHPEVTQQALSILRSGNLFQWYVITLLAMVMYVYANEISKKNWKGIAAGLALRIQQKVILTLFSVDAVLLVVFAGFLKWI